MTHLKKIIHSFVLIMLFAHHTVALPMHGHFSPAPLFSQLDSQSFQTFSGSTFKHMFSDISNNVTNNPHMYVVIAAGCIVAIVCTTVYNSGILSKNFNLDSFAIAAPIQKEIQSYVDTLPLPIKVIVVPLKTLIHMLRSGVVNYLIYNKKHLGLSTVSMIGGYVTGYSTIGTLLAGGILVHGGFHGKLNEMDYKLDGLDTKLTANQVATIQKFAAASDEAVEHRQAIIEQVDKKADELHDALAGVDLRITHVGEDLGKNIAGVTEQVVIVHGDVKALSGKIDALKIQLDQENRNGAQRDQKADETLKKLNELSTKADNSRAHIEAVALQLTKQQKELEAKLEGQMNGLNEQLVQQTAEFLSLNGRFTGLAQTVAEYHENNAKIFNNMGREQLQVHGQLAEIKEEIRSQNDLLRQQNILMSAVLHKKDQSTEQSSLTYTAEQINNLGRKLQQSKANSSSKLLQLTGHDYKVE